MQLKVDSLTDSILSNEVGETIKDLLREAFHFIRPNLEELFWVDYNVLYLNKVCGVSQVKIADLMDMSQLGVSKRVRTAILKVQNLIRRPESDVDIVRRDFQMLISASLIETAVLYYQVKTFSVVSRILGDVKEGAVRVRVTQAVSQLKVLSEIKNKATFYRALYANQLLDQSKVEEEWKKDSESMFEFLSTMSRRYYEYMQILLDTGYYSDYVFKIFDKERVSANSQ